MTVRTKTGRANINFYNRDNIKHMEALPDNYYKWAIADPPYFKGPEKRMYYGNKISKDGVKRIDYPIISGSWEIPTIEFHNELVRVSENQIIFGINYFEFANQVKGRIIWDKVNGDSSFSDCEIASCSSYDSVRLFKFMWNGMMQGKSITQGDIQQGNKKLNEKKIHVTQKPVKLYEWVLSKHIKDGDNVLETNGGSGSIAIAAWNLGIDLDLCEKDNKSFNDSWQRFDMHTKQMQLF